MNRQRWWRSHSCNIKERYKILYINFYLSPFFLRIKLIIIFFFLLLLLISQIWLNETTHYKFFIAIQIDRLEVANLNHEDQSLHQNISISWNQPTNQPTCSELLPTICCRTWRSPETKKYKLHSWGLGDDDDNGDVDNNNGDDDEA